MGTESIQPLRIEAWAPRNEIAPKTSGSVQTVMRVESNGSKGCYGGFELFYPPGEAGDHFHFSIKVRWKDLQHGFESLCAELDWIEALGWTSLPDWEVRDGWVTLSNHLENPGGASELSVKLLLRWSPTGVVEWKEPTLVPAKAPPPRPLRLGAGSVSLHPQPRSIHDNIERLVRACRRAGDQGIQLLCLPEVAFSYAIPKQSGDDPYTHSVHVPGPELDQFCEIAQEYRMALCFSVLEREEELLYNTAVLIDEDGHIAAKYRKVHLAPPGESWAGTTPGHEWVVASIRTSGARVGMNICMDSSQEESARCVARLGAEICLLPIMGDYRATAHWRPVPHNFDIMRWMMIHQMRAMDNQMYMVVSRNNGVGSGIFAPDGTTLVMDGGGQPIVHADVDLNQRQRVAMTFKEKAWYSRRESVYGVLAGERLPRIDERW